MIIWKIKAFNLLTVLELYAILQLRALVFVVEQNCPYNDVDDKDQHSYHVMGFDGEILTAYTRIIPAGISYSDVAAIGRVATSPHYRGVGLGKTLMEKSIENLYQHYGHQTIRIGAQLYLKKFYESFGFFQTSAMYLEDNIEHILMEKTS